MGFGGCFATVLAFGFGFWLKVMLEMLCWFYFAF
jgi:hypothetical protein